MLTCAGNAQKDVLICRDGLWAPSHTCRAEENCNNDTGRCEPISDECRSSIPGAAFCRGDTLVLCDPDLVAPEKVECTGRCAVDGGAHCELPSCSDAKIQIGEQCDDGNTKSGDGCSANCRDEVAWIGVAPKYSCALSEHGRVKCWGAGDDGVLGSGNKYALGDEPHETPAQLPNIDLGGQPVRSLTTGGRHACAILNDSSIKCWGANESGQLGLGDSSSRGSGPNQMGDALPAINLGAQRTAKAASCGLAHCCAILDDDTLKCWGANQSGQLGLGDAENRGDQPDEMGDQLQRVDLGGRRPAGLSLGPNFTCVKDTTAEILCWGDRSDFQLGSDLALGGADAGVAIGDEPDEMGKHLEAIYLGRNVPLPRSLFTGGAELPATKGRPADVAAFSCAILETGAATCWGQLTFRSATAAVKAHEGTLLDLGSAKAVSITPTRRSACVLLDSGQLNCFHGETAPFATTPHFGTERTVRMLAGSDNHFCALLNDRSLKCWGLNGFGALGLGIVDDYQILSDDSSGDEVPKVDIQF